MAHSNRDDESLSAEPPFRPLGLLPAAVNVTRRPNGEILLQSPYAVIPAERTIIDHLRRWSQSHPDRPFLAARTADRSAWRKLSYGELRHQADAVAQWLLDRGVAAGASVMILSGNSLEHAAMVFGAMTAGVIAVPISPAYSLQSTDHAKLKYIFGKMRPAVIFVQSARQFAAALNSLDLRHVTVVSVDDVESPTVSFADVTATVPTAAVEAAFSNVTPDTVGKILFTSGSTGWPKGVINTQRMMAVNVAMSYSLREQPRSPDDPPVAISWMPWHHTMAGNAFLNRCMSAGGTYYIDDGRPLPGEFARTIENLRDISPTNYSDAPAAYAMLADAMETDDTLRRNFFAKLESLTYAAASLSQQLWTRLQDLSVRSTGMRTPFTSSYGSTETSPAALVLHWISGESGVIGLPLPGQDVKLVPLDGGRYEIRLRGPNITPGYFEEPALTAAAFDEEGFFRMGDAARFVDPNDPAKGLRFAGRTAENFKLMTGTWVAASMLRAAVVGATMPLLRDAIVTGHDRNWVGILAWPNMAACRELLGAAAQGLSDGEVLAMPKLKEAIAARMSAYNAQNSGSSTRVARMMLMSEPPSADGNEITDKGYVNQSATLARRSALVDRLYADPPDPDAIIF